MESLEFHEIANIFPLVQGKDFAELKEDIRKNGIHEPIVVYDGKILDGRNRFRACQEIGMDPVFVDYEGTDPTGYVISLNLHRRHLNESQRAMVAAKLANLSKGRPENNRTNSSIKESSEKLNVGTTIVKEAKRIQKNGTESLVDAVNQGDIAVSTAATVASLPEEEQEQIVEEVKEGAKPTEALRAHVSNNTGNNEWYTPPEFIEAAREVMGGIDLDPASSEVANKTVKADRFFSKQDCGLSHEWSGRVWLNPPYAQPLISQFSEKICESIKSGAVSDAVVLVNNATETSWFQNMAEYAAAICFPSKRVRFLSASGEKGQPLQGQAILYFGDDIKLFEENFSGFGFVVCRCLKET